MRAGQLRPAGRDVEPGTEEAKAFADGLEDSYLKSIKATLAHLRSLAKDGEI